jgi:signal transduction histidine kinase
VRVGTRITVATSVLVAMVLSVYAALDLRSASAGRRLALEDEARHLAYAIRTALESGDVERALSRSEALAEDLSRGGDTWRVALHPIRVDRAPEPALPAHERLRVLAEGRTPHLRGEENGQFFFALPIRVASSQARDGFEVVGSLEVVGSTAQLRAAGRADLLRTLPLMATVLAFVVGAIMWSSRVFVSRPIEKLIAGIDDVAKGDLSRVLLSEREDEVGALAARFNEMTYSLRESQAETKRQNDAKMALEERLSHTEKLATLGQLAAEIAHEVGTPLSVIAGRARSIARKADAPEDVAKKANIIAEQALRITRIIERLLDMTRQSVGSLEFADVQINEITLTTLEFLEGRLLAAGVRSSLSRAEGLPPVRGHHDQLQQVLINLVINAIEAMPGGGQLAVETYAVKRRRPGLERAPEQPTVVVEVADSGVGIPAELRDNIFEPFYTSKRSEGGSGLGLTVSHGIIKGHDGWIEVEDRQGGGTVFRVFIPAASADPSA